MIDFTDHYMVVNQNKIEPDSRFNHFANNILNLILFCRSLLDTNAPDTARTNRLNCFGMLCVKSIVL